jgi:5,5'-dehydrodivanillate O-demethylase
MLSIEDNKLLTEVGPDKPMGQLLRRYWQPVAAVADLAGSRFRTRQVKILGEDLVLYRDRSGQLGMVAANCTHRRANLSYGIVEEDGIRCVYHGWKFDETGACLEQPYEDTTHPEDDYRDKCGIVAYPVQELAGLIWAYMGPQPAPLLPHWAPLVSDNSVRDIGIVELPCSWLQCQENTLDPVHTEWLHQYGGGYYRSLLKDEEPKLGHEPQHIKVGFDVFDYGIIKRRVTKGQTEDNDPWKIGHPMLFPNILLSGNPLQNQMQFRVPIDDSHTLHFTLHTFRAAPGTQAPHQDLVPARHIELYDEDGNFKDLGVFFQQDYLVWVNQGPIALRNLEKLGESDKGVILFRKQLTEQVQRVIDGQEPTLNVFRDEAANECIDLPIESFRYRPPPSTAGTSGAVQAGERAAIVWRYIPTEPGRSADADKIEAVMETWDTLAEKAPVSV